MLLITFIVLLAGYALANLNLNNIRIDKGGVTGGKDIIDTGYAKYLGNRSFPNTVAYLGVPYAEPPIGERRFRAPLPLDTARITRSAHGAVIDATKNPEFCIQGSIGAGDAGGAGSEDCLKVNIYTPVGAKRGSNLPVLVYIHGGGFIFGNPANWPFDHWIHQSPNVVIVSVYYRLDSFGFLSSPEFNTQDPRLGDLNAGFLDQIEALRWVKRFIPAFGGDPNKVTINGESAGGASVEFLLVANLGGEKLFEGAIAQSVYRTPLPLPEQQQPLFEFYASQAGCGASGGGDVGETMACLRMASVSALARAQDAAGTAAFNGSYRIFRPVLDGKLFTNFPTGSILDGKFADVPLIVGATTNETLSGGTDIGTALKRSFPGLSDGDVNDILDAYPSLAYPSEDLRFQEVTGDSALRCARTIMASEFSKRTNAWTYRYNQRNPTIPVPAVTHAAENWMMFLGTNTGFNGSTTFTTMTAEETAFAEELIAYWLSFVRAGNPNTFKLARSPVWPKYTVNGTGEGRARMVLQQDPGNRTEVSGSFVEEDPGVGVERCGVVAGKFRDEQN
ncbi:hypothetical protein AMATHDRAFT_71494 [Amanita thiersii Skay4041]|uniref:Carboxylic ester hydrolase n=1 Tax=Amanita thiersii Skay4041 TaxID=703135 RepID=A0A2A9N6F6_9AGAR|nr:hypothetical protein AMATHDRAFT_71494 [Amanita thiersii Skay4041]